MGWGVQGGECGGREKKLSWVLTEADTANGGNVLLV
jgi:hypothetical protein